MVWCAIYNDRLFDVECVSYHLQYASDVDIGSATGVRDVKILYTTHDVFYWNEDELPICIGRHNIKGTLNILKRRYKGDSYRELLKEYATYANLKRDKEKYELYYETTGNNDYKNIALSIRKIINEGFKLFDAIFTGCALDKSNDKWYGCLYGYLTPFECRVIAYQIRYPSTIERVPFVVSDRVFRFIYKCLRTTSKYVSAEWIIPYSWTIAYVTDPQLLIDD